MALWSCHNKQKGGNDIIELKAGYLVEIELLKEPRLCVVQYSVLDELVCSSPSFWVEVSMFNNQLEIVDATFASPIRINRVWGRTYGYAAYDISNEDRELLWEREEQNDKTRTE